MPNGRPYIRGFHRHVQVQNGRGRGKTFETHILQSLCGRYIYYILDTLNSYHPNINITLEKNPKTF